MTVRYSKLLGKLAVWLTLEIVLNLMGLDELADYSEFVFDQSNHVISTVPISMIIA